MGRLPAIVIVARHGARLDAADPLWHLSSPTPYDPPLTYGGWRQSQALGARIASILQAHEAIANEGNTNEDSSDSSTTPTNSKNTQSGRRKYRVVIHSSPFLRCIQTSIAISAGLKQFERAESFVGPTHHATATHILHSGDPHTRTGDDWKPSHLSAIPEPDDNGTRRRRTRSPNFKEDTRVLIRVDAFLGEWLSPEYYVDITPPPGSKMMVASAKADLLRRADPIDSVNLPNRQAFRQGNFPGGWKSNTAIPATSENPVEQSALDKTSALKEALPKLGRAYSHNIGTPSKPTGSRTVHVPASGAHDDHVGYEPLVPSYAISPSQPIPRGYVAHARDACVNVDYQWDSLRPPLEWGDGGDFGEEWSAMHKRFRRGLHHVLLWYRNHSVCERPQGTDEPSLKPHSETGPHSRDDEDAEDEDLELVLVLVTHGAGSNALIGAITNQPVLIDVGMASLTMAERKNVKPGDLSRQDFSNSASFQRRRSSFDTGISDDYEVKLTSSTEHLRPGSRFMSLARPHRSPSLPVRDKSPYRYERHVTSPRATHHHGQHHTPTTTSPLQDTFSIAPSGTPSSANHGPIRRSATTSVAPNTVPSPGLWSKPAPKVPVEDLKLSDSAMMYSPKTERSSTTFASELSTRQGLGSIDTSSGKAGLYRASNGHANGRSGTPTGKPMTPTGLWGPPSKQALSTEREKGSKRRWTLSQA